MNCPVKRTLDIIGRKWTVLILRDLCAGKKRFGELRKSLAGISPKTLAERLRFLEKKGIVSRKVYPQVPLRVEYALTVRGKSLSVVIQSMKEWGEKEKHGASKG